FLRTSVDHGTAFDIAGKNMASEVSMIEALKKSVEYSSQYRNFTP
ncbi:MAG: 4-hydroxythreonine-4-phosphate dehydrogenase PdxA, partial [Candidatus Thermoplasmatota archaeon]|nr:4-hydroxythreonine-4-phosphate dehydrogenase PdxA [Candidatus Thermoplasmatota archaeon]